MRIAREALPFVLGILAVAVVALLLQPLVALVCLAALLFTLWFFRDPERSTPAGDGVLVSPADGRIIKAGPKRISIFMNVFDVHVCRAPLGGTVASAEHVPGRFLAAYKDRASDHNERVSIVLTHGESRLTFTLIAGLVARRIVCKVGPGQTLTAGQRVGLIRFGSRVDVDLPGGAAATVELGQRVVAGETVIGRLSPIRMPVAKGTGALALEVSD